MPITSRTREGSAASSSRARYLLTILLLAGIYFAAAKLGLSLASVHTNVSPVWPPTGIAIAAILFALVPLGLARLWSRKFSPLKPGPDKNATYECGLESKGDAWVQFKSEYYLYAIVFLIFDVETIFLLPFAVAFAGLPAGAFVAMMIFLLLLIEGLIWAWKKGVLTWK